MRAGLVLLGVMLSAPAAAAEAESWALHVQSTFIEQYHPAFRSLYRGANSLDPGSRGNETFNITAYAGVRPWEGGEAWADLELDQGFGLSNTLGVASFPNGQGSKVGKAIPYYRLHRLFFRQTFDLGGDLGKEMETVEGVANQLAGSRTHDNLILTLGKISPTDVFDTNSYAHDPMHDFLGWAIIEAGPWDYAADAWGYSYGAAAEWSFPDWSLRAGLFNLSREPNGTELTRGFGQYQIDLEAERRFSLGGRDGKLKLLGFASRGRLANYNDAVAVHLPPDVALVRKGAWKSGLSLNGEQAVSDDLGVFLRASLSDGSKEGDEFTDMANSVATSVSLKGAVWDRSDDTIGIAFETGGITSGARRYFSMGGLGILIGDGRLDHYARENVAEAYYAVMLRTGVEASLDYQFIANPAYNADRGPVSVFGFRLHGEL